MTIPDGSGARGSGELVGQRLGGYLLESLLGAGGMAEVYRARELALDREVAVKVLPAALARDPDYVQRFRTEAKRFAALEHPHIVPVYHFDDEGSLLYLVMPILKESLRDRLERESRLDPDEAIRLVGEIASALEMAHTQGLVHRDVKPENVLLDEAGKALLTDFGIARHVTFARQGGAQTLSGTGLPVGTPEYMAPEQLRNEGVDQRADIYALGAMLYELLTGQAPHEAGTPYEVAALVLTAQVTPPSVRNPQIWPALERVVLTALAFRAEDRYADAASFAAALQEALAAPRDASATTGTLAAVAAVAATSAVAPHLSRPLDLSAVSDEEIDKAPTVPAITIVRPAVSARVLASLRRQRVMFAAAATLVALMALGGGALAMAGGLGSPSGGMQTIFLPGRVVTATIPPGTPATALATQTPRPTATATLPPTPTPLPGQPLYVSQLSARHPPGQNTCAGTQYITNHGARSVGWTWQSASPSLPSSLRWSVGINTTPDRSGMPQDRTSHVAPGATDYVNVQMNCDGGAYSVHVGDTLGFSYTFVLTSQPRQGD